MILCFCITVISGDLFTAAFLVLSNAELLNRIKNIEDNRNSQETELNEIEEPMKSAI